MFKRIYFNADNMETSCTLRDIRQNYFLIRRFGGSPVSKICKSINLFFYLFFKTIPRLTIYFIRWVSKKREILKFLYLFPRCCKYNVE